MSYTRREVLGMMKEYKNNLEILHRLVEDRIKEVDSTRISNYGIGSSMPNGNRISDRVFMAVNDNLKEDRVVQNFKRKIEYINNHIDCVENYKLSLVLSLRLEGRTSKEIGKIFGVGGSRISNMLTEIAEIMLEADKEKV